MKKITFWLGVIAITLFTLSGVFTAAKAEEVGPNAPVCNTVEGVQKDIAAQPDMPKAHKVVSGEAAVKMGEALGAPFKTSDLVIYVKADLVLVFAFEDGCYKQAGRFTREQFETRVRGVL